MDIFSLLGGIKATAGNLIIFCNKSYLPLYKIILSLSHQQKTDLCLNCGHCL